jgi:DNA-binding response OmpR family regulator
MKRILIVEDDVAIQDIFRVIFETYGYSVECMDDARKLIQKKLEWPDAIILDRQLPYIDGVEACRFLKAQPATREIPIILITAGEGITQAAQTAGADDFFQKPFDMKSIVKKVSLLIAKKERTVL